jgi:hypothetical protein
MVQNVFVRILLGATVHLGEGIWISICGLERTLNIYPMVRNGKIVMSHRNIQNCKYLHSISGCITNECTILFSISIFNVFFAFSPVFPDKCTALQHTNQQNDDDFDVIPEHIIKRDFIDEIVESTDYLSVNKTKTERDPLLR